MWGGPHARRCPSTGATTKTGPASTGPDAHSTLPAVGPRPPGLNHGERPRWRRAAIRNRPVDLTLVDPAPILPLVSTASPPIWPARPACAAAALVLCAVFAAAQAAAAPAEPAGRDDALLQLLHDRGLLDVAAARTSAAPGAGREASGGGATELVLAALNFLDVPYQRGGSHFQEGFDCSGFTRHVFALSLGLVLPRRAEEQAAQAGLLQVSLDELRPGDLVFFDTMRRAFSHVGIYIGDGRFIHAARPGADVRVESMRKAYWERRYNGARRAAPPL